MTAILQMVPPLSTPRFNLDTCAMLVELSASTWTARKLDRGVTTEVNDAKGAKAGAARVNKHLLAGRTELEAITKLVSEARNTYLYGNTMPWSDNGLRLVPATRFMEVDKRLREYGDKFHDLVKEFINIYPSLITAQAMALGDMFKREDYPTVDKIATRFSWSVNYYPVPQSGDFRVDVGADAAAELKQRAEQALADKVRQMRDEMRTQLKEHLQRMSRQLKVEGENKGKLYETLLSNGIAICDLAKSFDDAGDPEIKRLRADMAALLTGVTIDELRKNDDLRMDTKTEVDALLNKLAW